MINRQTYGILDFLGDIGGLIDAMKYIVAFLLSPYWNFKYASFMLTKVFRVESSVRFIPYTLCFCTEIHKRYKRLLKSVER